MQQLGNLLTSIVPTFGIIGVGMLCRRLKIWDKHAVRVLNSYAYFIALPALIFESLYTTNIAAAFSGDSLKLISGTFAAHFLVFILALIFTARKHKDRDLRALAPMLLTFGSTAYLGIPFVTNTFGEIGAAYGSLVSVTLVVTLLFLSIFVLRRFGTAPDDRNALLQFIELPFVWAVIAGLVLAFVHITLPQFVTKTVSVFAGSAGPTALLAIGAFDFDFNMRKVNVSRAVFFGVGKVFLTGITTFLILKFLGVTGVALAVGTAMGAVSIAVTAFVLADQYKVSRELTNASIAFSGFASFVALTAISFLWFSTDVFK